MKEGSLTSDMPFESAEILARALEEDAALQESGDIDDLGMRWDEVYGEIFPFKELDDSVFGLAMRFWDDWGDASRHEWQYYPPFVEADWPRLAREIAEAVRKNQLPSNPQILEHFLPKPRTSRWKRIRSLFGGNNNDA